MKKTALFLCAASAAIIASPAMAKAGDPIPLGDDLVLDIMANARLRYETVDQANIVNTADALTTRARLGAELKAGNWAVLVEGEGTFSLVDHFNDTIPGNGVEPYPVVADPDNLELNRAQVSWMKDGTGFTLGRQRINLDNQRFVGAVGWRQNEQTFDALRMQAKLPGLKLDFTYGTSQRTVFGVDSPSEHYDGDMVLVNGAGKFAGADVTAFAYLLDFDTRAAFSSQTYGLLAQRAFPIGPAKLTVLASYARQSDFGANPKNYSVDYANLELTGAHKGFSLGAGYELLGSDGGLAAFQTPLATLHAFNGWADLFLTTPNGGLQDLYLKAGYAMPKPPLPGLVFAVQYHRFDSDFGSVKYGNEWDASVGFKLGQVGLMAKYARYEASAFGSDTSKVWLQAEWGF
ncbi:MAG: alginate export family protein [Croceibacterium sp.]